MGESILRDWRPYCRVGAGEMVWQKPSPSMSGKRAVPAYVWRLPMETVVPTLSGLTDLVGFWKEKLGNQLTNERWRIFELSALSDLSVAACTQDYDEKLLDFMVANWSTRPFPSTMVPGMPEPQHAEMHTPSFGVRLSTAMLR